MKSLSVWVFCGPKSSFPAGVFSTQADAEEWIVKWKLSGTLTEYPVGQGTYEWAIAEGYFIPKKPEHNQARFIERFSSACQTHYHYEDGIRGC